MLLFSFHFSIFSFQSFFNILVRRNHLRTVLCDCQLVFEVSRGLSVVGVDGPTVIVHVDAAAAQTNHGLNAEYHTAFDERSYAGTAVIGNVGLLVHAGADAVATEFLYNAVVDKDVLGNC